MPELTASNAERYLLMTSLCIFIINEQLTTTSPGFEAVPCSPLQFIFLGYVAVDN